MVFIAVSAFLIKAAIALSFTSCFIAFRFGLFIQFVLNPAYQSEHGDTDRQSHAEEESQEAGAGANDDEDNEDCPKDYSNHNFSVL